MKQDLLGEWRRWSVAGLASLAIGCAQPSVPLKLNSPVQASAMKRVEPQRMRLGTSVKHRPIEMLSFGDGSVPVLILAGIHGDEPTSVTCAQRLVELLRENPTIYRGRSVSIIPVANPDGYAAKSRYNANRIDVNRNFPAKNFKPSLSAAARTGKTPASEPETRALLAALEQVKPRLIISIHSISRGRECNNYDGPADGIAALMSRHNGYPATSTIGYPTPGSMGSYCGQDLRIPMITLELPKDEPGETAWEKNREALITAIRAAR